MQNDNEVVFGMHETW